MDQFIEGRFLQLRCELEALVTRRVMMEQENAVCVRSGIFVTFNRSAFENLEKEMSSLGCEAASLGRR